MATNLVIDFGTDPAFSDLQLTHENGDHQELVHKCLARIEERGDEVNTDEFLAHDTYTAMLGCTSDQCWIRQATEERAFIFPWMARLSRLTTAKLNRSAAHRIKEAASGRFDITQAKAQFEKFDLEDWYTKHSMPMPAK